MEGSVSFKYNLATRDPQFDSKDRNHKVVYSVHEPKTARPELPILVLLHHFNASRHYWKPQIDDPALDQFTKISVDALGHAHSRALPPGEPWSFDAAAESIKLIIEQYAQSSGRSDVKAVLIGDSMGGAHTGLRCALRDNERLKNEQRILGVVACGTAAEEESTDFVKDYTKDAQDFADKCTNAKTSDEVAEIIEEFAENMGKAGYTDSREEPYASARTAGTKVIADALKITLSNAEGELVGHQAGATMKTNYHILNYRKSLIPDLAVRPSPMGSIQCLVAHGTLDAAYPFDRNYHERTVSAIGQENAELLVVQGGTHFLTASHWKELDEKIVDWMDRKLNIRLD